MNRIYDGVLIRSFLTVALSAAFIAGASAQLADRSFFKGKVVRIVVGYSPGGGYDSYARMIAPRLAKELPGSSVVVENKPGAAGLTAFMSLIREKGDGLQILLLNGEAALMSQTVEENSKYDIGKVALLGRVSFERRTLVTKKSGSLNSIRDFSESSRRLYFGAADRLDSLGDPASILCFTLKIDCKLILGFHGATDVALAIERGEVDALVTSESQSANLIKAGKHVALAVLASSRSPLLPEVPTLKELLNYSHETGKWIDFRSDAADFGRVFVVPADTPAARIAILQSAFASALSDPDIVALGEKTNRPIAYAPPDELKKTFDAVVPSLIEADRLEIRRILLEAY